LFALLCSDVLGTCSSDTCVRSAPASEAEDSVGLLQVPAARHAQMRQDDPNDPTYTFADLGPLLGLLGTWEGSTGRVITPTPQYQYSPVSNRTSSFLLRHQYFNDTITFEPILGAAANRGYQDADQLSAKSQADQLLLGIQYTQTVYSLPQPEQGGVWPTPAYEKPELLHQESGQWFLQKVPGIDSDWSVMRMAIIPHGVTLLALGKNSTVSGEALSASFAELDRQMTEPAYGSSFGQGSYPVQPFNVGEPLEVVEAQHYTDRYSQPTSYTPADALIEGLGTDVGGMEAVKLDVSTMAHGGNLAFLPNVEAQVKPENFNSTFWLETWADGRQQLQYVQSILFRFQAAFFTRCATTQPVPTECLIKWPHTFASTLKKVKDYECPQRWVEKGICAGSIDTSVR